MQKRAVQLMNLGLSIASSWFKYGILGASHFGRAIRGVLQVMEFGSRTVSSWFAYGIAVGSGIGHPWLAFGSTCRLGTGLSMAHRAQLFEDVDQVFDVAG